MTAELSFISYDYEDGGWPTSSIANHGVCTASAEGKTCQVQLCSNMFRIRLFSMSTWSSCARSRQTTSYVIVVPVPCLAARHGRVSLIDVALTDGVSLDVTLLSCLQVTRR